MKKPINYRINSPNQTAVNILRSWLNAVNVPHEVSNIPEFDIIIKGDPDTLVKVCINYQEHKGGGVSILARDITGKNTKTALEAFRKILEVAGYPSQSPLNRGPEPRLNAKGNPSKLHYKNEDFLVAIRHTEFRRSPNPPEDRWTKYKNTIEAVCTSFYCLKRQLCDIHGITKDDLLQYARCLTVNFCARYEIPNPIHCDNERKLYEYLRQRFIYDLFRILRKRESTLLESEIASIARFGDSRGFEASLFDRPIKPVKKRRLNSLLNKLPHDQLIEVLTNAANDDDLDSDARYEAKKRLKKHVKNCSDCMNLRAQEIEEFVCVNRSRI